ncbi:MAG: hypothetical protein PUC65_14030 [Clostridiales bacterium]|nr:hypothetical protein [Clostridiales bacterium]
MKENPTGSSSVNKNYLTVTPLPTSVVVTEPIYIFSVDPIVILEDFKTPYMSKEEFPILDGSTANIPLGEIIYSYLTKAR